MTSRNYHQRDHATTRTATPRAGKITRLAPQARNSKRLNVDISGQFAFSIAVSLAETHGLAVGNELTLEEASHLIARDQVVQAIDAAIRLLTLRPRSELEIRQRLRQKNFTDITIDATLQQLRDWNYVDDEKFTRYWIDNRESHKPRGRRLLTQELRQKGIDNSEITTALDEANINEAETARKLAQAKLKSYRGLDRNTVYRRLGSYLVRRGYDFDTVKSTLSDVLNNDETPDE